MKKILVVEDEKEIANILKEVLNSKGYSVETVNDGLEAFHVYQSKKIDLIITDLMMPNLNGTTFIEMIRTLSPLIPIIAITAYASEEKAIEVLHLGADDFIPKPFSIPILLEKVDRLLKKDSLISEDIVAKEEEEPIKYLDEVDKAFIFKNEKYILTSKEFQILKKLIKNEGDVVSREEIAKVIWDEKQIHSLRNVDNHIRNLRRKIPGITIQTHSKVGYRFVL